MTHTAIKKVCCLAVIAISMLVMSSCGKSIKESDLYGRWKCTNMEFTDSEGRTSNFVNPVDELYYELLPDGKCIAPDGVLWKPTDRYTWELKGDSLFVSSSYEHTDLTLFGRIVSLSGDQMVLQESDGNDKMKVTFQRTRKIDAESGNTEAEAQKPVFEETPDLATFGLKGNVKSVTYADDSSDNLKFDSKGRLTGYGELSISYGNNDKGECCGHEVKRDEKGRIVQITPQSELGYISFTYNGHGNVETLEFNPDGFMTGIPQYRLQWDSNGQQQAETVDNCDIGWEQRIETAYSDYQFDKQGNWTSRKFVTTITTSEEEYDSEGEGTENTTNETRQGLQKRKIAYY